MKRDVKEMIRYNPPNAPSGTLQINEANFFKFPIQEKSARGLLGHLRIALKEAYNRGYDDCAKWELEARNDDLSSKLQSSGGRIKRVYLKGGSLMIASYCRSVTSPQKVEFSGDTQLLRDQINAMIEDAEERGFEQGRANVIALYKER